MSGWPMIPEPTTPPEPTTMLNTPGGNPASSKTSQNFAPQRGVMDEGLKTTVHPEMRAAPLFQDGIAMGKFQGVMRPTGPTGKCRVRHILSGSSLGVVSPKKRRPSPAMYL